MASKSKSGANGSSDNKNQLVSVLRKNKLLGDKYRFNDNQSANPNLIRRFLERFGTNESRIEVRVAAIIGDGSLNITRNLVSALGVDRSIRTRHMHTDISINFSKNITSQITDLFNNVRSSLAYQKANIMVWGQIPDSGSVIHLRFIPVTMWDQQAPGAFNLETKLVIPIEFEDEHIALLRFVTIAAAIKLSSKNLSLYTNTLKNDMENAALGLTRNAEVFSSEDQSAINSCYASALCVASFPHYDSELLSVALEHFRTSLSLINQDKVSSECGHLKKHIGSILHIEANKTNDINQFEESMRALTDALKHLNADKQPYCWSVTQYRLGLIAYHKGLDQGDTNLLKSAVDHYKAALKIYNKGSNSLRWAEIMSNFAQALLVLGGHTQSLEAFATSANACLSILEVRSPEKMPLSWASTQNNLGSALFLLGKQTRNIERLKKAKEAFESCLKIYQNMDAEKLAVAAINNLKRTNEMLTNLEWEQTILINVPRDPSGLPEPGEGLTKRNQYMHSPSFRRVS